MATLQLLKEQKSKIESIMNQYGARDIRVFGSVARMEDSKNSDIDFLVKIDEDCSAFDLIHLKDELEKIFKKNVDIVDEDSLYWYLKDKIMLEAVYL